MIEIGLCKAGSIKNSSLEIFDTLFTFDATRQQYLHTGTSVLKKKLSKLFIQSREHAHVSAIRLSQTVVTHVYES